MKRFALVLAAATAALSGCTSTSPGVHQASCIAGTAGGAALGTVVGNEFGQGRGRDLMTVTGGVAGALAGQAVSCR